MSMSYQYQPPPYSPPPDQPAPAPKVKRWPWILGIVGAFLVGVVIGGAATSTSNDGTAHVDASTSTVVTPQAAVPEPAATETTTRPEPAPTPEPAGETNGSCDMLLFVEGQNSEFAASIDVTNTGNIGIVVKVTASFDQLGRGDHVLSNKVRVKPGRTETVNLSETIDMATVDRYQSGGYSCRTDGEIINTFGKVQG